MRRVGLVRDAREPGGDTGMKVRSVTYSRLVSGPGYSNQTIGATAVLESFDTPEAALAQLERWVNDQFGQREEQGFALRNAQHELYEVQVQLNHTRCELEIAQQRWEAVKGLSERLGVDLLARVSGVDDIPF
jgi:hypothetical protein